MRKLVISFMLATAILATGACSKKEVETATTSPREITPEAASPNDSPATVTMTDGSQYRGALVSKNGSQMTFRGDNGATRTLDSRDIRSIRFGDSGAAGTNTNLPSPSARAPLQNPKPTIQSPEPAVQVARSRATVPSGTQISIRNNDAIDSKTASAGQTFSAVVTSDVVDGVGANKRTAVFAGGGAAVGALIGGLVGGGKGAGIGAASVAGAGAGTQIMTRGSVKIPSESLMSFTLEAPLAL